MPLDIALLSSYWALPWVKTFQYQLTSLQGIKQGTNGGAMVGQRQIIGAIVGPDRTRYVGIIKHKHEQHIGKILSMKRK